MERKEMVRNYVNKLNQFNLSEALLNEMTNFIIESNISEEEIKTLCGLVERSITQHYVKRLLMNEIR